MDLVDFTGQQIVVTIFLFVTGQWLDVRVLVFALLICALLELAMRRLGLFEKSEVP
jgi:hypothetical protein